MYKAVCKIVGSFCGKKTVFAWEQDRSMFGHIPSDCALPVHSCIVIVLATVRTYAKLVSSWTCAAPMFASCTSLSERKAFCKWKCILVVQDWGEYM